jgi:hypothetical protein
MAPSSTQTSLTDIVREMPESARLVEHVVIRHGLDRVELFRVSVSGPALRDTLVYRWRLRDLGSGNEEPVSFVLDDHPTWWPSTWSSTTRRYGSFDADEERYWSVWEQPETGELFVEVGTW